MRRADTIGVEPEAARAALERIVRRIVDAVAPEKIVLFGSAARGTMKPSSDFDLLVIKSGDYHHIDLAQQIYMAIGPREFAVDITVATPAEVERFADEPSLVIYPALREGKVVYDVRAA